MDRSLENLRFRRQFILGPNYVDIFGSWNKVSIASRYYATVHPDLNICQVRRETKSITLLGYILDPYHPQYKDEDILTDLLIKLRSCADIGSFFQYTYPLGGRWILVIENGDEVSLFNDAAGYRQVYYTTGSNDASVWCGSDPLILADLLNLEIDVEVREFVTFQKEIDNQYWLPGDTSLFEGVKHLLPNHYLNLRDGFCKRYWPDRKIEKLSLKEVVRRNSEILTGLIESACNRFDLAMSLTSGLDTRLLLAGSRNVYDRIYYFTMIYWDMDKNSADVKIPRKLLSKLGIEHHIIECPSSMEKWFKEIYDGNVSLHHDVYGVIAQGMHEHYPKERVCVKGNAIPITKCVYARKLSSDERRNITSLTLARLTGMGDSKFVLKSLDDWISGAQDRHEVDLLDLFFWENREGNWQAMSQLEWDIVQEVFVPYNCREFLVNMLSVEERFRRGPDCTGYRMMISKLWPEVLSEPINPHKKRSVLKRAKGYVKRAKRRIYSKKRFGKWWLWMWATMQLSDLPYLGCLFARLAALPLGPYRGRRPLAAITKKAYISYRAEIQCSDLKVASKCFIDDFVTITSGTHGGSIILSQGVHIYRNTILEVNRGAKIIIGPHTHIQTNCVLNALLSDLIIGSQVMIGPHCGFFTYQHRTDELNVAMCKQEIVSRGDIVIEDDVWLGMGVKIMDGVHIGRGAIIGAGAVVTRDVPSAAVAVGVPAKVVKVRG